MDCGAKCTGQSELKRIDITTKRACSTGSYGSFTTVGWLLSLAIATDLALDDFQASFRTFKRNLHCSISTISLLAAICCERICCSRPLTNRYQHILVDEFQDTDPLQSEILFLLCVKMADKPCTNSGFGGQLFLVGDQNNRLSFGVRIFVLQRAKAAIQRQWPRTFFPSQITSARGPILDFVNQRFAVH